MDKYFLAVDIGTPSGWHIVGWQESGAVKTKEIHRVPVGRSSSYYFHEE